MDEKTTKAESITLYSKNREWLGQIVITEDGFFGSVTDYGNFSYAWRYYGEEPFKKFLLQLNPGYFSCKMQLGMAYQARITKEIRGACDRFADIILPALQAKLKGAIGNG